MLSLAIFLTVSYVCFALDLQPNIGLPTDDKDCKCVSFFLCKNGTINQNGAGLINIRANEGDCPDYLQVCCKKEDKLDKPIKNPKPTTIQTPKGCGYRRPDGVEFQITGNNESESQYGEFPWMVALFKGESDTESKFSCGGALVHEQVVLTAAHCVDKPNIKYKIRVGEWDSQRITEPYPHHDIAVKSVTIHPEFYDAAVFNDIAFLVLENPVKIAENVNLICLPPANVKTPIEKCVSTGWGKDKFEKEGVYQSILKKIDLPFVAKENCQEKLKNTRLGEYFELHKSFMCAGGEEGKDVCTGDGGSPLVCPMEGEENRYYHAGIVSWGIGCGEKDIPGVYADVSFFRNWIDDQMRTNNFTINY